MAKPRNRKHVLLSEDMIVEIFLILPLKSLLRFKCVSKRWRFVISSKPFINTRLKNSSTDPDLSHHHLIANLHPDRFDIYSRSLRSVYAETEQHDEPITFGSCNYLRSLICGSGNDQSFYMKILGSCNGLILISGKSRSLIIWNPAIRKAKIILPPNPLKLRMQVLELPPKQGVVVHNENFKYYCFGYDESAYDFKAVRISITHTYFEDRLWTLANPYVEDPHRQTNSCVETHVYSSGTRSWKKIESSHDAILRFCDYLGKFVNGRLHWLAFEDNNHRNRNQNRKVVVSEIVCLDLVGEEEKYEVMGGPENVSILEHSQPVLKDLGGYLSLICLASDSEINIWVMMKYGDSRSWTKNLTLMDFDLIVDIPDPMPSWLKYCSGAMPLWLKKNGDMAVYFGPEVFIYNGKDYVRKSPVDIQLNSTVDLVDIQLNSTVDSVIYVESLEWPFGDRQHR